MMRRTFWLSLALYDTTAFTGTATAATTLPSIIREAC